MEIETKIIDAADKKLGRVATAAATILLGKNSPAVRRNLVSAGKVKIINVSRADISGKKISQKKYSRYTGYPGGLRQPTMRQVIDKKGYVEIFRKAVYGMLPNNKLRKLRMKNLKISN